MRPRPRPQRDLRVDYVTRSIKTERRGLVIRKPYVDWILAGKKTWEIRGSATKVRGRIALIAGGTGTVVGTCELVDVRGPLKSADLKANARKLNVTQAEMSGPRYYGDHTYAWVLTAIRRLRTPIRYRHPSGAVIWVTLTSGVATKVGL
jgi:hypothetical protein